ncbi:hypothetical protein PVAP13_2KG161416 [Panicum virgatum]|uniref:Uncharacterized protein n=1 Tax=Panicum virgatum TaxID=38727 RepID=A0A8T0VYB2_PANVG|nr:hypothetical protein PVAP13_2KG161416 [Panicum virgatum]
MPEPACMRSHQLAHASTLTCACALPEDVALAAVLARPGHNLSRREPADVGHHDETFITAPDVEQDAELIFENMNDQQQGKHTLDHSCSYLNS